MIKKILQFIKDNIITILMIILIVFVTRFELPYVIYTPGGAIDMSDRIEGDNLYSEEGSLSMTYVSMMRGAPLYLLLSYVVPNWDIVPTSKITYDEEDLNDTLKIDRIYLREANSNAEYAAYNAAGIDYNITKTSNVVTTVYKGAKTNLKHDDEIISIDGNNYTNINEFQSYVETKNIGDVISIEYNRGENKYTDKVELINIDNKPKVGIGIATICEYETKYNIKIKNKPGEAGPSGGFITALAIYNHITEEDITKGKKIMGTGTIDKEGNVGEIGGVKYKILGAVKKGAKVFICPNANYDEAVKTKEENNLDVQVIGVSTFEEAISKLKALE